MFSSSYGFLFTDFCWGPNGAECQTFIKLTTPISNKKWPKWSVRLWKIHFSEIERKRQEESLAMSSFPQQLRGHGYFL